VIGYAVNTLSAINLLCSIVVCANATQSVHYFYDSVPYGSQFRSSIHIVAALDDTCVGVYSIDASGVIQSRPSSAYLAKAQQNYEFVLNTGDDSSQLYVNSSRPVAVMSGVTCGNVLLSTSYCDHMSETIPPISELGKLHVVPPIIGRTAAAGYLVRVVASTQSTRLTWTDVNHVQTTATIIRGTPYEINTADASVPILIECIDPCLVMQYNKGPVYL